MNLVNTQSNSGRQLFAGEFPRVLIPATVVSGAGVLLAGTILGKITKGTAIRAVKAGGNTGDGTLTLDAVNPVLTGSKAGVYKVRIIRAAAAQVGTTPVVPAQKAIARLEDPDGNVTEVFEVNAAPGITVNNKIKFTIAEGSVPFAADDGFDITIEEGSGKYKAYNSGNTDGSEKAVLILSEDADTSLTEFKTTAYASGHFNASALTGLDDKAVKDFEFSPVFIE